MYNNILKQKATEDANKLSIANSIWFADRFAPRADFLQKNADYYNAAAYKANFSDSKTVADINNWISEKTKGMIKEVIQEIDPDTVMFLINALAFEDEWLIQYDSEYSVRDGEFTTANGEKVTAQFMHGETERYIYDENAEGFIKRYKGKYAFAALLPKEGMSIEEYVSTLSGEKISTIIPIQNFAEGKYLLMSTKNGLIKKTALAEYNSARKTGLLSITLKGEEPVKVAENVTTEIIELFLTIIFPAETLLKIGTSVAEIQIEFGLPTNRILSESSIIAAPTKSPVVAVGL